MTVSDNVFGAIEKTLLRTPAIYRYNEVITKTFLVTMAAKLEARRYFYKRTHKTTYNCIVCW